MLEVLSVMIAELVPRANIERLGDEGGQESLTARGRDSLSIAGEACAMTDQPFAQGRNGNGKSGYHCFTWPSALHQRASPVRICIALSTKITREVVRTNGRRG
jgi:hypothetical protein